MVLADGRGVVAPRPLVRPRAAGLVLAAGAGTRMGVPKALVRDADGRTWLSHAVEVLEEGGCEEVTVVLGAQAEIARTLVPAGVRVVTAHGWAAGLSASLAAGLACFLGDEDLSRADCAIITLVDLPELRPAAVRRVLGSAPCAKSLRRAVYDDAPGHPVVVGRDHWAPLLRQVDRAGGDRGAGPYLRRAGCEPVDCTDLGGGCDVDSPPRG